jgi:hypothetical protein
MKPLPYEIRLAVAMRNFQITLGSISTVTVQHDTGCPMLTGKPTCRCVPDVSIETTAGRIEILPDGSIRYPAELN